MCLKVSALVHVNAYVHAQLVPVCVCVHEFMRACTRVRVCVRMHACARPDWPRGAGGAIKTASERYNARQSKCTHDRKLRAQRAQAQIDIAID